MYTHVAVAPLQLVYVHVYVLVPEQTGLAPSTGPVTVNATPQELSTVGFAGTTCALLIQATVEPPAAGMVNVGGFIV